MSFISGNGLGVKRFFGPRTAGEGLVGGIETRGSQKELTVEVTGKALNDNIDFLKGVLPAGAKLEEVVVRVDEAFVVGGTSPTLAIGTDGSETTNGFEVTEAQLEAVGTYVISSFNGTWANGLSDVTTVGVALGGTSPTVTSAGKARITARYTAL